LQLSGRVLRLVVLGLLLEGLYLGLLVVPFSLPGWLPVPAADLASVTHVTRESAAVLLLGIAAVCLLSWLAYRQTLRLDPRAAAPVTFAFAALFAATLVWVYPLDALDVFDYAMQGRILSVLGGNPYHDLPAFYPDDPFLPSVGWKQFPSVYGPAWVLLEGLIGRLCGDNQLAALLALKGVAAASGLACCLFIHSVLRRWRPERAAAGVVLFGWNPLVVVMMGSGHNDVSMAALLLAGIWLAGAGRPTLGGWVLGVSAGIKLASAPILPALALGQVRSVPRLVVAGVATVVTLVGLHVPLWVGWDQFGPLMRLQAFTPSPLGLLRELWQADLGQQVATDRALLLSTALTALLALAAVWRARRGPLAGVEAAHDALFWIVFVALPWWQPWYLVPLAALAAVDTRPGAARLSWIVAAAGLVSLFDRFYLTQHWLAVWPIEHELHTLALVYLPPVVAAIARLVDQAARRSEASSASVSSRPTSTSRSSAWLGAGRAK
jgi:hypothetical protein